MIEKETLEAPESTNTVHEVREGKQQHLAEVTEATKWDSKTL